MSKVPTPKQPQPEHLKDWYPYYAGFTESFASAVLDEYFPTASRLLDPWNGSGTTTAVAVRKGISCTGIDINPVMTVISRARLTPYSIGESLQPIALEIIERASRHGAVTRSSEPLCSWLRVPAVAEIRQIQSAIHHILVDSSVSEESLAMQPNDAVASLPLLSCFFYAALFAATRDVLKPFRSKNPTWLLSPASPHMKINPSKETIERAFLSRVAYLSVRLRTPTELAEGKVRLSTQSVLEFRTRSRFDACLTSPPYATRVDYIKSTLPELSVLGLSETAVSKLRREMTGTPVVKNYRRRTEGLRSASACKLITNVAKHPSHGSSNYYAPWLEKYLRELEDSLMLVEGLLSRNSRIGVLVQDSNYKSERIDLQTIVTECMETVGMRPHGVVAFPIRHSMARMNPAARIQPKGEGSNESLLIFDKWGSGAR